MPQQNDSVDLLRILKINIIGALVIGSLLIVSQFILAIVYASSEQSSVITGSVSYGLVGVTFMFLAMHAAQTARAVQEYRERFLRIERELEELRQTLAGPDEEDRT